MVEQDDYTVIDVPNRSIQPLNNSTVFNTDDEQLPKGFNCSMSYPNQSGYTSPKPRVSIVENVVEKRPTNNDDCSNDNNGWTEDNEDMLRQWADSLKTTSFAYQYLLDKSYSISTQLSLISICSSSILSIFAGFKLWIQDNKSFQNAGDIVMLFSNFIVAAITTASKRYLDDNRNQKIRTFLNDLDKLYAIIVTQLSMLPEYRINAKEFFDKYKESYTRIMVSMPNVSIKEITIARNKYIEFEKAIKNVEYVDAGTSTDGYVGTRRSFIQ